MKKFKILLIFKILKSQRFIKKKLTIYACKKKSKDRSIKVKKYKTFKKYDNSKNNME